METRDYIGGTEYVDGVLESIYHTEGRLHYINGTAQMEYTTVDHLGNTRLSYADLNGNGIIETPSEILDEVHYYPNGLKMEGYWMNSDKFRYTFNGIEGIDDFGLNVNRATFRTLDSELGRWWSVDPQATHAMDMNPYNSMYGSPMVFNDPNGDCPMCIAAVIGAVAGGGLNLASNWGSVSSFADGLSYFGVGAAGGAVGVFNPALGGTIIAGGNLTTDFANGTLSNLDGVGDWATHLALTGLEATGAGAASSLGKGGANLLQRWGWTNFNEIVALGADDIALTLTTTGSKPTLGATVQTVSHQVTSQQVVKSVASTAANGLKAVGTGNTTTLFRAVSKAELDDIPVSYTHLTLPTICSV